MKTKILCLLLALVMIVGCFAGCNNNKNNNDDKNEDDKKPGDKVDIGGDERDPGWWDNIAYDESNLVFQMTNCSNSQELPSGCNRFLAGGSDALAEDIDDLVAERNSNAYDYTKVNVTYKYYEDLPATYGYANAMTEIERDINNGKSDAPDMYCNWMTDLLICSLKGCFANLYTAKADNFFDLKDEGYMADLMGSLTLNTSKVYVIASDYFLDLIRAFFVIPVNANLYNQVAAKMGIEDLNGDGMVNIEDFFEEVKPCDCRKCEVDENGVLVNDSCKGNWNYARLAEYAGNMYTPGTAEDSKEGEDITDTLGFALGANGLPAAGLIYTSSVTIISKTDNGNGTYTYAYPEENQKLYDLVKAVDDMMDVDGVIFATKEDAGTAGLTGTEQTPLLGIRRQFTTDKLLFGGIILVGSLEYQVYQDMKEDDRGGFGVVPVPVYQYGDAYLTQIHVVGRAGAINHYSTKFSQCSAFLQYQSSNSTDILNDYYEYNLTAGTASGVQGNVEMLEYIRQNVRTSFDKLFEDAIGYMYPNSGIDEANRYHTRLAATSFEYGELVAQEYKSQYATKSKNLENLEAEYQKLPS